MAKIRFLHVPKTAGASFTNLLQQIYLPPGSSREQHFIFTGRVVEDLQRYRQIDPTKRSRIRLITGHAPLALGEPEIDDYPTITLLRDPIERAKSFCQHVIEGKSPELFDRFPLENFDLDKFLMSRDRQLENLHARFLLGNIYYDIPDEDHDVLVKRAIEILTKRIKVFGIVEYFDESLMLFRQQLGWPLPVYRRLNVKDKSKLLTFNSDHIAMIREMNDLDIPIYEAARKIFEQRMEANSDYLKAKLQRFNFAQKIYTRNPKVYARVLRAYSYLARPKTRTNS